MTPLNPTTIAPPFARYAQGTLTEPGVRLLATSGQLGLSVDGDVPDGAKAQAEVCFANIDAILSAGDADRSHVVRLNAYVTDRAHMAGYMAARDEWLAGSDNLPASTLVIVSGFTRPEFVVEIEALAAVPELNHTATASI